MWVEEGLTGLLRRKSCWPACVALRWYWNSGARQRLASFTAEVDGDDGMTRGLQSPSFTIQRAWHRIGNRKRKAIQPVPNAYEDAAQTIGGRKTHGDKSDGVYRKARPPATYTQSLPSRSVVNDSKRAACTGFILSPVFCLLSSALL